LADAMENSDKVADSCKTRDEQTLDKDEFSMWPPKTNQTLTPELPAPLPDGRIFPGTGTAEDPIPYIPTENPKMGGRTPIILTELDG